VRWQGLLIDGDDDAATEDDMTSNKPSTYTLKTRYGINETFSTLAAAKQYMAARGDALVWERYDDNAGTYWLGYADDGIDAVAEIR